VKLKKYDYDKREMVEAGEVSLYLVAKNLDAEQLAKLLDDYCNNMRSGYKRGVETGHELRRHHRTLQRSIIVELVGIIAGLSEQDYTDARNEQAVELAKKIKALYEEHGVGRFI
jgi:hypothetical protein